MAGSLTRELSLSPVRLGAGLSLVGAVILTLVAFTREEVEVERPWQEAAPIGFTTLRTRSQSDARMIPLAVWYPAAVSDTPRLRVGDYFALADSERTGERVNTRAALTTQLAKQGASREDAERWMNALRTAHRDAPRAEGRHPLILMAAGNDESAGDQAVLAEHLAARGYVVAAAPFPTRIGTEPMRNEGDIARVADAQVKDLEATIEALAAWPTVDTTRIAVVGHSFGARSALLLAMRTARVRAVASLDGGIGSATGQEAMEHAASWNAHRRIAPVLHVYETRDAWMRPDRSLLRRLDSTTVWLAEAHEMHHHHFTTLGSVPTGYEGIQRALGYSAGTAAEFWSVAALVTRFLDAQLRSGPFGEGLVRGLQVQRLAR